jgi:hypothetical protein
LLVSKPFEFVASRLKLGNHAIFQSPVLMEGQSAWKVVNRIF